MIIWFDNNMVMHVDKKHDASNSFVLANYVPDGENNYNVVFKANAVVNGHTLLLTHTQVTYYASRLVHREGCYSTIRRAFFKSYLPTIEKAISDNLRKYKNYKGDIKLRFRVGKSSQNLFSDYNIITGENSYNKYNEYYATYLILEKSI